MLSRASILLISLTMLLKPSTEVRLMANKEHIHDETNESLEQITLEAMEASKDATVGADIDKIKADNDADIAKLESKLLKEKAQI